VGRGSSVGIVTDYGLGGTGIETQWGREFSHTSRQAVVPNGYNGYRVFPGGKAAGAWCWPPTPSYRRGQENVELYLYPLWAFRFVTG
jgi:hypothetical protein